MSTIFESVAKNYRQWYLEDRPQASGYALTMLDPAVLAPILEDFYNRLLRNRWHYLPAENVEWGRSQALYQWVRYYFDRTDPQKPGLAGTLTGEPVPLTSIGEGKHHFLDTFNEEFGALDTMHVRETDRLRRFEAMNGEDGDCYYSYMGPTGGAHIRPINTKSVGYDGIAQDVNAHEYRYNRMFNQNPTSLYGKMYVDQEERMREKYGIGLDNHRTTDLDYWARR